MKKRRQSGILLHPTSFPGKYGIGDLGEEAYEFIDFLKDSKQTLWQILPLNPTSFGDSPYQSFSSFAGNTLLISPDLMIKEGYLKAIDEPLIDSCTINYDEVIQLKNKIFQSAFDGFLENAAPIQIEKFKSFCALNSYWLDDFALFISIKEFFINKRKYEIDSPEFKEFEEKAKDYLSKDEINDFYYGASWVSWPHNLVQRHKSDIDNYTMVLSKRIDYHKFLQYEFCRQWSLLKTYSNDSGISIIGDIPIFVSFDSADTWANQDLFLLDKNGFPIEVAGVPPDYFSETGQLWGNPVYNWDAHKKSGFDWWIERISQTSNKVDIIRVDHFRGFVANWSIAFGEKTAINGSWKKGPGLELFTQIRKKLGDVQIIAEDLGIITSDVEDLRDGLGLPGMKILQFAFNTDSENAYLPHNLTDSNCVVYTGTHDNNTIVGWYYDEASEKSKDYYRRYLNVSGADVAWDFIKMALSCVSRYAIIPLQDYLCLGSDARSNTPGTPSGNWQWRYNKETLKPEIACAISYLSELYNRNLNSEI